MTSRFSALAVGRINGLSFGLPSTASARDWYVSSSRGKGKKGTKEKPAKDLGNIIKKLSPGDIIHIAAGTYLGKGKNGADWITVPVRIIGGYDDTFAKRDPWGAHQTIFSGQNGSKNYRPMARLHIDLSKYRGKETPPIEVDGIIIDQAAQNRYKTAKKLKIVRKANPKTGETPTPDRGALIVSVSKINRAGASWNITVQNNVIINCAASQGCLTVRGHKNTVAKIKNNLLVNNTGTGIYATSAFRGKDGHPRFDIGDNTVLFTWKYDAYVQSYSGNSLKVDDDTLVVAYKNVFAFADRIGVMKSGQEPLTLMGNIILGNVGTDYYEANGDQKIALADLEDEAEWLGDKTAGNGNPKIDVKVSQAFKQKYAGRTLIDRNAAEADIKAEKTNANALRSILGLNTQAKGIDADSAIWLPMIELKDALQAGVKYKGIGASKPAL